METYHIVEITIDGIAVLQLLFRQSDGYLIAFRLLKTVENQDVWEGWFHFSDHDIKLPHFFGQRKSLEWDCGYLGPRALSICRDTISQLVSCLLEYTQVNCTKKSYGQTNRVKLLHTWMLLLGECQRSAVFLEFVEQHHESEVAVLVGIEREDHLHGWSTICTAVLNLYLAVLMRQYRDHGWEAELANAEEDMNDTVTAITDERYNYISKYIVYHANPDGTTSDHINGELSLLRLVGTGADQLLHLIKYDDNVLKIHKLMKKYGEGWPDAGTDPDSPERAQPDPNAEPENAQVNEGSPQPDPDAEPENPQVDEGSL